MSDKAARRSRANSRKDAGAGPSLRDRAYDEIRRRINTLAYRPGAYLNEAIICEELQIGRTPTHMAVERLALEGMLQIIPGKGIVVSPISLDEIRQINQTRRLIEPAAAGMAALGARKDELDKLRDYVDAARATPDHDTNYLVELDRLIHATIADATRNRVLASVLKSLHERSLRNWHLSLSDPGHRERVLAEHEELIAAIIARDSELAMRLMQDHTDSFSLRALNLG